MPKVEHKKELLHKLKPYTRVTFRSINRLTYFHPEDKTNLTNISRGTEDYSDKLQFNVSLKECIIAKAKETGRKIKILDAGCGSARMINQLLSDKRLVNYIESISGISLHYFTNIQNVIKKHERRFNYYSGTAENVLAKAVETTHAFDLIFDVWGAYSYSKNKFDLLKQYHAALKPGGQAYVFSQIGNLFIKDEKGESQTFSEWASKKYPQTFTIEEPEFNETVISIKKTSARLLLPECTIQSSIKKTALGSKKSLNQLKKGNALRFYNVVMKPDMHQPMELRVLPFSQQRSPSA